MFNRGRPPFLAEALSIVLLVLAAGSAASGAGEAPSAAQRPLRSASEFLSPQLGAEQADDARNRGMLWVEHGAAIWDTPAGPDGASCRTCHADAGETMRGAAARYPALDRSMARFLNLEGRINACRSDRQRTSVWGYESPELLAMTAYLAHLSRGVPRSDPVSQLQDLTDLNGGIARRYLDRGRHLWSERQGQLNLSCAQCHDQSVGRKLRGDTISGAVPNGYPAYRLEWNGLGSLHRRLRACQLGVRAVQYELGSDDYLALETFLAWRSRGLPMEAPAIRR